MLVSDFDFTLPEELIATKPVEPRDSARLLHVGNEISDFAIKDIPSFLKKGDVMVFNNTEVIPARLFGKRGDAKVEVTLHMKVLSDSQNTTTYKAFAKPAKKLKIGDIFKASNDFFAEVTEKNFGEVTLEFNKFGADFDACLAQYGETPLPPYIASKRKANESDKKTYQTIYAKHKGAVAAPTAGLHFTDEIFTALEKKGIKRAFVTLHVGAGTFLPVKVDDTKDHKMHSEWYEVPKKTADIINEARKNGGRIIAVGTTSLRTLESASDENGTIKAETRDTDIFITPGYKFKAVDMLFTNFHTPKSTLFMLVSAFAGSNKMKQAYNHAIAQKYRFYSYGDACLLEKT